MTNLSRIQVIWSGTPVVGGGLSTFYMLNSVGTVAQQVAAVATFLDNSESSRSTSLSWATSADVAVIDDATGNLVSMESVTPETGVGTGTGDLAPYATQGLLRLYTTTVVGGRLLRGRLFLPGVTEGANTGIPSAGYISNYNTVAAALISDANTAWAVWSRTHGTSQAVSTATTWNRWAVLRSRRD